MGFKRPKPVKLRGTGQSSGNIFRNLRVAEAKYNATVTSLLKVLSGSNNNRFYNTRLTAVTGPSAGHALHIDAANNIFQGVSVTNATGATGTSNGGSGVYLGPNANGNILTQVVAAANADSGILVDRGYNNILSHVTAANNAWNGILFKGVAGAQGNSNNLFNSVAMTNGSGALIGALSGATSVSPNHFINVAATDAPAWIVNSENVQVNFSGYLMSSSASCTGNQSNLLVDCNDSSGSLRKSGSVSASLVGKVDSETSDGQVTTGMSPVSSINTLQKWLNFENFFRGWGLDGDPSFPASSQRGVCLTGSCRIWDWRIKASSDLYNRSVTGGTSNAPFSSGAPCPAGVDGNATITANSKTFMKNAIEISLDGQGNDNGLCESNESCLYAPNIGAYQGEGDYQANLCLFSGGVVNNLILYSYPITGI